MFVFVAGGGGGEKQKQRVTITHYEGRVRVCTCVCVCVCVGERKATSSPPPAPAAAAERGERSASFRAPATEKRIWGLAGQLGWESPHPMWSTMGTYPVLAVDLSRSEPCEGERGRVYLRGGFNSASVSLSERLCRSESRSVLQQPGQSALIDSVSLAFLPLHLPNAPAAMPLWRPRLSRVLAPSPVQPSLALV